ncbi:MAG: RDD family protein, partial [Campylobacterota bacterium]|nr:RDD family protein [Campylobacterota bacterium]
MNKEAIHAGFWVRFVASLLDTLFIAVPIGVIVYLLSDGQWMNFDQFKQAIQMAQYGNIDALEHRPQTDMRWELLFELLMAIVIIVFWKRWAGATPGKHIVGIEVVNASDLGPLSNKQLIIRYIGYIVSIIPLMIGFFMVAFRSDKRALHDLLA